MNHSPLSLYYMKQSSREKHAHRPAWGCSHRPEVRLTQVWFDLSARIFELLTVGNEELSEISGYHLHNICSSKLVCDCLPFGFIIA